ncbi:uncharacterized protein L969DRAFT_90591 [Mixia osmundae IAM 14324]|uniref:uncharacterized protein n=1 Tax=Mixia osmundae (strain CBS 9802 / IAM 14324 / JCM 22182 / KY 12970) TaxID=764103 RepID=UPI0004A54985|nr:uncharacterized protein L969DRAFT_90591 [Mixia osmundae IAM 14324]KEI36617.1 hypothetical protein L969DRAFT_90591 [Mixia osmundae IAM 14324]
MALQRSRMGYTALLLGSLIASARAQADNAFEIVGNSGASAQQVFLLDVNTVMVVDKTEGNGNADMVQSDGNPAWATTYDLRTNTYKPLDVTTNSFCAGGSVLGNGTWLNVGGNQAIRAGGLNSVPVNTAATPYFDADGGRTVRMMQPCTGGVNCAWTELIDYMPTNRWYPTLETLGDGSVIIIGGCLNGAYVNDASQNVPTYQFVPPRGDGTPIGLNILTTTLPLNLFPLTWLLPSGYIFINSQYSNELLDVENAIEHPIADMPHGVRVYPASATTVMLPLTPANNWTATLLFCGGNNLQADQWVTTWNIAAYPAMNSCVRITPDVSANFEEDDDMLENRIMGNGIMLPDGRMVVLNGIGAGTAGYGNNSWSIGQSYGSIPIYAPAYYNPEAALGSRWTRSGMSNSTVPRMYHSSALLLPDGAIWSAGSNPNADFVSSGTTGYPWGTEYRVENFRPDYYSKPRPSVTGLPTTIGYGGNYIDITMAANSSSASSLAATKVVLIRTGFSTHSMNMGQRFVQLNSTATLNADGTSTIHTSQLPPNPNVLPPGPALMFVVVNGVPSIGEMVMVGNGQIGTQPTNAVAELPMGNIAISASTSSASASNPTSSGSTSTTSSSTGAAASSLLDVRTTLVTLAMSLVAIGFTMTM